MTPDLFLAYITTVFILLVSPGPSHLLMLSNSLASGFSRSCRNWGQSTLTRSGRTALQVLISSDNPNPRFFFASFAPLRETQTSCFPLCPL